MLIADIFSTLAIDTTQFQSDIHAAKAAMDILRAEMQRLNADVRAGHIPLETYASQMNLINQASGTLTTAMQGLGGSQASFGRATLLVSQGLEDLQYGMSAVLNNIPGIVMAFGYGAGLAGAISLASVGATVLYRNFDTLSGIFRTIDTKSVAEQMKELAKNTEKTADETLRLAEYEERRRAGTEALTAKSKEEEERMKAVKESMAELSEGDINNMISKIKKGIDRASIQYRPEEKADLERAKALETGVGAVDMKTAYLRASAEARDLATLGGAGAVKEQGEQERAEGKTLRMETERKALDRLAKEHFDAIASMYKTPEEMAGRIAELKKMGGFEKLVTELEHFMEFGITQAEDNAKDAKKNAELTKKSQTEAEQQRKAAETKAASDTKQAEAKSQQILQTEVQRHAQSMIGAVVRGELAPEDIGPQLERTTGEKPSDEVVKGVRSALTEKVDKLVEDRMNAHPKETREEAIKALEQNALFDRERKDQLRDRMQLPESKEAQSETAKSLKSMFGKATRNVMSRHREQGIDPKTSAGMIREQIIDRLSSEGMEGDDIEAAVDEFLDKSTNADRDRRIGRGAMGVLGGSTKPVGTVGKPPLTGARNPFRARDAMRKAGEDAAESREQRRFEKSLTPSGDDKVVTLLEAIRDKMDGSEKSLGKISREGIVGRMA